MLPRVLTFLPLRILRLPRFPRPLTYYIFYTFFKVMRTSLSRSEFANALGMKSDDVFVKMMFNIVDKDGDGRISFQEFLDTVVLFSRVSRFN